MQTIAVPIRRLISSTSTVVSAPTSSSLLVCARADKSTRLIFGPLVLAQSLVKLSPVRSRGRGSPIPQGLIQEGRSTEP